MAFQAVSLALLSTTPVWAQLDLTILHVNEVHSRIEEESFGIDAELFPQEVADVVGEDGVDVIYGGYPRLVAAFDGLQSEAEASGSNVVRLHAGDAITGSFFYTAFNYTADADMMSYVCFNAFTAGNHEFDDGDANYANFVDALVNGFPRTLPSAYLF